MGKYLVTWKARQGASAQQNHDDVKRLLDAFAKWQAPADETFHQFLLRLDGQGGYAVVETDSPEGLLDAPSKFGTWNEFEITPVIDIAEGVAVLATGAEFREAI